MVVSTFIMANVKIRVDLSQYEIEMRAREFGMEYKEEYKVIEKKNKDKSSEPGVKK